MDNSIQKAFEYFGVEYQDLSQKQENDLFKSFSDSMNQGKAQKTFKDKAGKDHVVGITLKKGDVVTLGGVDLQFQGDHYEVTEKGEGHIQRNPDKAKTLPYGTVRYVDGGELVKSETGEWLAKSEKEGEQEEEPDPDQIERIMSKKDK